MGKRLKADLSEEDVWALEQTVDHIFANFDSQFKMAFRDGKYVLSDLPH